MIYAGRFQGRAAVITGGASGLGLEAAKRIVAEGGKVCLWDLNADSLAQAQEAGYMAMQFNYVVSTNAPAVELYKKLGFAIVGTLPKAFRHKQLGLVDAYVMYRFLSSQDAAR